MANSPKEFLRNSVKEKLSRDQVVASMIVRLVRSVEIAQIAKTAGFDSFYIDMEHNSFSFETTAQLCMAGLAAGIAPFVRVPASRRTTFRERSTAARWGSLRLTFIRRMTRSVSCVRLSLLRSASGRSPAGCRTCSFAHSPPQKPSAPQRGNDGPHHD